MSPLYGAIFEISGKAGMFADPGSGSEMISYLAPPPSACIGMMESICRVRGVHIEVVAVAICSRPEWSRFTYNSRSPFRKLDTIQKNAACQLHESILVNPCFQIAAVLSKHSTALPHEDHLHINSPHSMQEQFFRRLTRNQSFYQVSLGRQEFLPDYVGRVRTPVYHDLSTILPVMVVRTFDSQGEVDPVSKRNLAVEKGILRFTKTPEVVVESGLLRFADERLQSQMTSVLERMEKRNDRRLARIQA